MCCISWPLDCHYLDQGYRRDYLGWLSMIFDKCASPRLCALNHKRQTLLTQNTSTLSPTNPPPNAKLLDAYQKSPNPGLMPNPESVAVIEQLMTFYGMSLMTLLDEMHQYTSNTVKCISLHYLRYFDF